MKSIILFTRYYPYSLSSEDFISNELEAVSGEYDITLVPFSKTPNQKRDIPQNVRVNDVCCNMPLLHKIAIAISILFSARFWTFILSKDFLQCKTLSRMIYYCKIIYGAFVVKWIVKNQKIDYSSQSIFYSYWLTYAPLGLAMLKQEGIIQNKIIARTHGYEIYEKGSYKPESYPHFPARMFTYKWIDNVYSISKKGVKILTSNYPYIAHKFKLSHLGVNPIITKHCENKKLITIISCSYLYELKRVPLIFQSLNNYCKKHQSFEINWYHIGSSRFDQGLGLAKLKEETKTAVDNLRVFLLGEMSNQDVIKFYQQNSADVFINLSTTEGIPVSIMEAESAGLAILATDVGSNNEIVNDNVGVLLDVNFTQEDFDNALNKIISNRQCMSENAIKNFIKEWDADTNYNNFYREITH